METKQEHFDTISLHIASPDRIREWSRGEVTKPETINYRTGRSERNGLFDERIFGPEKDYECYCGKYRRIRYKGIVCEKCGVEVTRSIVRRERMGHIELASPVAHIWLLRGIPSRLSLLLGVPISQLEKVVYFAGYIVSSVNQEEKATILKDVETEYKAKAKTLKSDDDKEKLRELFSEAKKEIDELEVGLVLNEVAYHKYALKYGAIFEAGIGAEAIYELCKKIDLPKLGEEIEKQLEKAGKLERKKLQKRLSLVRAMKNAGIKPEWMFLTVIPIIPPALRPMVALDGGRHATSDVNDLYRRVINRNNRLKKLKEIGAPDVILRNEKRILQEAVDSLIDNSIRKQSGSQAMSQSQRRTLKSLSDNLKGKQGLFRQNLLGKRVDYSGRSVIVVGPTLNLNQCGLPKLMALELFRPFVISEIIKRELAFNVRGAGKLIEEGVPEVWEILEEVIQGKYVLLNRAPTLHRLSIQAFQPILIEGNAIQVHPLVCSAFNADFDGDQMAVHVPLSEEAQAEARELIASNKNLLKPQDGRPIVNPSQDIALGCYWMTKLLPGAKGEGKSYQNTNSAILAYDFGEVHLRAKIWVMGSEKTKYTKYGNKPFETSVGRLLFNSVLPEDFEFLNEEITKKRLGILVDELIKRYGIDATPPMLDKIKRFGYQYVARSGVTFGLDDVQVPEQKKDLVAAGRERALEVEKQYQDGLLSRDERHSKVVEIWDNVKTEIKKLLPDTLDEQGPVHNMIFSGARGDIDSLTQMSGMKGLIVNTAGDTIALPIIPSYKEGLSPLEYFITTHGARKGLTDVALNTARAGYLTRRLVTVAQDVVITETDCKTKDSVIARAENLIGVEIPISKNVYGRVLAEDVKNGSETLAKKGTLVDKELAQAIEDTGITEVAVRTPLTCATTHGVCQQCYGLDMGRNRLVKPGEAVGIVAAQAIGEPGTQLTLRTFHAGGVTGLDITTGLPRVEEIFERRAIKNPATVCEIAGNVGNVTEEGSERVITVISDPEFKDVAETKEYRFDIRRDALVEPGQKVHAGQLLSEGSANIDELFKFGGRRVAEEYIIREISKVYELHAASITRKHIEIIARQMFSRVRISEPGDTLFTTGDLVEYSNFVEENAKQKEAGGLEAHGETILLGITEVSLSSKSWMSSASFQHTTRTLVSNAVKGEADRLRGLNENVIIGHLIPAGTGFDRNFIDGMPEEVVPETEDTPTT